MKQKYIKVIEVQNGYIKINLLSASNRMADFAKTSKEIADRLKAGECGLDAIKGSKMLAKKFDAIFGCGACKNTFLTDLPSMKQLEEFWNKFEPLLNRWIKEMEV